MRAAAQIVAFETEDRRGQLDQGQAARPDDPVQSESPRRARERSRRASTGTPISPAPGSAGATAVIVGEPDAFTRLAATFGAAPLDTLKAWMAFRVADQAAPYLSSRSPTPISIFVGKALIGQAQQKPRWKRGMLAVAGGDCGADPASCFGTFNWGVGELYAARYFPPETKAQIEALVGDVKAAFRDRLQHLDWMSPATKAEALKKLDTYTIKVGYPDTEARLFRPGHPPRRPRRQRPPRRGGRLGNSTSAAAPGRSTRAIGE